MSKKKTFSLEELETFLSQRQSELRRIELDMSRRYSGLTYSEIRDLDHKAGVVHADIKKLKLQVAKAKRKLEDKAEEDSIR